ncbi:hypothetical protein [Ruthenibacterium lactatiformans]|uniref:hypothetical protein n=1 Tax=Ruthenibacterium lactatiformans TaxID=1550024 RepID=UPI00242AEFFC|nr:hypothetical protein [Ruthenibacterium lactatiformans]
MANNIGPKIAIDGEAEFRRQIQRINNQAKELASEMKAVTASFTKNTTAQERATATSAALTKQIQTQKDRIAALNNYYSEGQKKLSDLEKAMQDAVKAHGADSKEAIRAAKAYDEEAAALSKYKVQINNATAELGKMENELAESTDASDDLGDSLEDAGGSAFSFGDALKANVLSQAIVDGVKRIADAIKDMAGEFIDAAATVKAENSQFEQTFGDMGQAASQAIGRVADESGILQTRLNGAGTKIYAFAKASGGNAAESLDIMERALQAAADSAAYYDRSLEDTVESLQSFLKGNYENDAALGLSATEATRNAKAMELFGQKFNDLTEIQKQDTLLSMVEDAQELSGAMGQAAREADGWENVQGNLNEAWRQFQAEAGAPLLEALIPIIQQITDALVEWTQSIDWDSFARGIGDTFDFVKGAFDGVVHAVDWKSFGETIRKAFDRVSDAVAHIADSIDWEWFGETINNLINAVLDNGPLIITLIGGIATGFAAWNFLSTINGVVEAVKAFKTANETASTAQALLNAVVKANPFVLLASLVAAVVGALATLFLTNEDFRNSCIEAWEAIKEMAGDLVNAIVVFFTETIPDAFWALVDILGQWCQAVADFFTVTIPGILNAFSGFLNGVFAADWANVFGPVLGGVMNGFFHTLSEIWESIKRIFNGVVEFVKGVFTGDWQRAWQGVVDIFGGIFDGIKAAAKAPLNALIGLLNGAIGAINRLISGFNGIGFTMPKWLGGGSFHPNIPTIPSIPYLAEGGTVRSGYAIVGEAGPELLRVGPNGTRVTPLSPGERAQGLGFGGITINVYGAEGQDVNVLADIVSRRLETKVQQIAGAWV